MASHNVTSKCDRALVAYLISLDAGTAADVYPAKRSENRELPCTVCHCQKWKPLSPHSGNYVIQAQVMVRTDPSVDVDQTAGDKKAASAERVAATFDAFFAGLDTASEKLGEDITTAARAAGDPDLEEFTVQSCEVIGGDDGFDPKGNAWVDSIDLEIVCCPKDVS